MFWPGYWPGCEWGGIHFSSGRAWRTRGRTWNVSFFTFSKNSNSVHSNLLLRSPGSTGLWNLPSSASSQGHPALAYSICVGIVRIPRTNKLRVHSLWLPDRAATLLGPVGPATGPVTSLGWCRRSHWHGGSPREWLGFRQPSWGKGRLSQTSLRLAGEGHGPFFYLFCFAATQLALQVHQKRLQVLCSNKEARKRLTELNGAPGMDLGHMNVGLRWCICMLPKNW